MRALPNSVLLHGSIERSVKESVGSGEIYFSQHTFIGASFLEWRPAIIPNGSITQRR